MENTDYEKQFTSTGAKLLRHTEAMKKFHEEGTVTPIVAHVMPTSECNLRCGFCSVKDRKVHQTLSLDEVILPTIDKLRARGLKAVILSGGGEPTLYKPFDRMIDAFSERGLEIGLITNGTLLNRHPTSTLEKLEWMRVSINAVDYVDQIEIPKLTHPTVGFSYIVSDATTPEGIEKIRDLAKKNDISYVRLLPDCAQPLDKLLEKHKEVGELAKKLGEPFFHQFKVHETPEKCFLGYFHPVLYCDGNIYPCDSLVLNDFQNQQFQEKFKLCRYDEIDTLYSSPGNKSLVDTKQMCPNCVFTRQNTLLQGILEGTVPVKEVAPIKHENFI